MRRLFVALIAAVLMLAAVQAAAAGVPVLGTQTAGQDAQSGQMAGALSGTDQALPANGDLAAPVLSPTGGGTVSQSNDASSGAAAGNANDTDQAAGQTQLAGGSGDAVQAAGQLATNAQLAAAKSDTVQVAPSNDNLSVRVLSPGSDGSVSQSNTATSGAVAGNANDTDQKAGQTQLAGGSGDATQSSGQAAGNEQAALADSKTVQVAPSNDNISVRVLSPGDNGSVTQSNTASSAAAAGNANSTDQTAGQNQVGGGYGDATQTAGQLADSKQAAAAGSETKQIAPSNSNIDVRILSPGSNGSVTQSNNASSAAIAGNSNDTKQLGGQNQVGGGYGDDVQSAGQAAGNEQLAAAGSETKQIAPSNSNIGVRVLSPGSNGSVTQSNNASSAAIAGNANDTKQLVGQNQVGGGSGNDVQTAGQAASNAQAALADSKAVQIAPSNSNIGARVLSPGDDGSVTQSNDASSAAIAGNLNGTLQGIGQIQVGGGYGSGDAVQVAGQAAYNAQLAAAKSDAIQIAPSNDNLGARVLSPGGGGSVSQSNDASSLAAAGNANWTGQFIGQNQVAGNGGNAVQAAGQLATNEQLAGALSGALQVGASNANNDVHVLSPWSSGGTVSQSNSASSAAIAANLNKTGQAIWQNQTAFGSGAAVQAAGQAALSGQAALAASFAAQLCPSNKA